MLVQGLVANEQTNQGTLQITCEPGHLAELMGLMEELKLRPNMETGQTLILMAQDAPPIG